MIVIVLHFKGVYLVIH